MSSKMTKFLLGTAVCGLVGIKLAASWAGKAIERAVTWTAFQDDRDWDGWEPFLPPLGR